MIAVLSGVLAATVALIPGARAGLSASSKGTSSGTTNGPAIYGPPKYTVKESSVECTAHATATSYSDSASAFVSAMADAIKYGCSEDLDKDWKKMVDIMNDDGEAFAFAYAAATADVKCKSKGNAYGCAAAHANAKAWAKAVLVVYADAWALAINHCDCKKHSNTAIAADKGSAHEFERLYAKVEATADAYVCVEGDDHAIATADSVCLHSIWAQGWAQAIAVALIDGECYPDYHGVGLEATAKIKAKAKIERWDYIHCV